jgi:hypothetical protein
MWASLLEAHDFLLTSSLGWRIPVVLLLQLINSRLIDNRKSSIIAPWSFLRALLAAKQTRLGIKVVQAQQKQSADHTQKSICTRFDAFRGCLALGSHRRFSSNVKSCKTKLWERGLISNSINIKQ